LTEPCALLSASQRAANSLIKTIEGLVPADIDELFAIDSARTVEPYQLNSIVTSLKSFETIFKNDMPEMSTFGVSQIGIFRTEDLIKNPFKQIAEPNRSLLQEKGKIDITEAGKCLAFRLSTATAFHICRAIESGIDQYYEAVAGKPYEVSEKGGNNNWGAKITALVGLKADERVTEFLLHIKKQYRNPVTHPEVLVDEHEAVDLFVAGLSAISMMLGATKALKDQKQMTIPGIGPSSVAVPAAAAKVLELPS
jgi:hypothetical protein